MTACHCMTSHDTRVDDTNDTPITAQHLFAWYHRLSHESRPEDSVIRVISYVSWSSKSSPGLFRQNGSGRGRICARLDLGVRGRPDRHFTAGLSCQHLITFLMWQCIKHRTLFGIVVLLVMTVSVTPKRIQYGSFQDELVALI